MTGVTEFAKAWRPEPDETIAGKVLIVDVRKNQYGEYSILTVKQDNGENLAVHCFHTVLKNGVDGVGVGDHIKIKYHGKLPTKDGERTYNAYTTEIEPSDEIVAGDASF